MHICLHLCGFNVILFLGFIGGSISDCTCKLIFKGFTFVGIVDSRSRKVGTRPSSTLALETGNTNINHPSLQLYASQFFFAMGKNYQGPKDLRGDSGILLELLEHWLELSFGV